MPLPPLKISATGTYVLGVGSFDTDYVSGLSVTISGLTGSVTLQKQQTLGNIVGFTPTPYNCSYYNANTDAYGTAGVAITADGQYLVPASAATVLLSVTAVTGSFTVVSTPLEGAVGGGGSSGGGGGGASTVAVANAAAPSRAEGASVPLSVNTTTGALRVEAAATPVPMLTQGTDQTGAFFMPPMDAVGREGYQIISGGTVAVGASAAGLKPVIVGGPDASANVQSLTFVLPSAATSINTSAPLVMAQIGGRNSTSGILNVGVGSLLTDGATNPPALGVAPVRYNAASWDREYSNINVQVLASAARTATQTSADQTNFNHRGIVVVLDMTVVGTGSVTVTINGKDSTSGKYYQLLAGLAIITNSTNTYTIFPGATAVANASANAMVPRLFQVVVTANNANSATYSVGYSLIV